MKTNLDIQIIYNKGYTINLNKIKIELIKIGLKAELIIKDKNVCIVSLKSFKATFDLEIEDIINCILLKTEADSIKQIKYKLDFYTEFERLIHFFLLDFKLNKELKESIEKVVIRIINTPILLCTKELKLGKIKVKNKNILNISNLRNLFELDKTLANINDNALKEKIIYFIVTIRVRVMAYSLI